MGTSERREREKESRRLEIIHAAEKVIFSKGFDNTTMDEIAKEAELSKGTIYLYFQSKLEVYLAIIKKSMSLLKDYFRDAVKKESIGILKVRAIGEAYIKFNKDYPNYYSALIYFGSIKIDENTTLQNELSVLQKNLDMMEILTNAIQEGIEDGSIRPEVEPNKTALLLWGETSGLLQLLSYKGSAYSKHFDTKPEEMVDYFLEFTYHALKAN